MNYAITVCFNEVLFLEASDKEEAEDMALAQFEAGYDLAPGQAYVDSIKELK